MFLNQIQAGFQKTLTYFSSPELKMSHYKYVIVHFYLKTHGFDVKARNDKKIEFPDQETLLIYSQEENSLLNSVGIITDQILILFSLAASKGEHGLATAYKEGILGTIPLQFSKDNMLKILGQEWNEIELWEYRSKKSKAQAYIKDESVDKKDIKMRLTEDKKKGLKPYFASFKVRDLPKKFSFSIYGSGATILGAEQFSELIPYVSGTLDKLISYEARAMDFVREVKLAPKPNGLPYISIGASIRLKDKFDVEKFKKRVQKVLQVTTSTHGKKDDELLVYDKHLNEFLSLTALSNIIYVFPRTTRDSQQESLVANLAYYLDELFGIVEA